MERERSSRRDTRAKNKVNQMLLTIDSSVIIAALRDQESKHKEALNLFEKIVNGDHAAIMPYTVLTEIVSAIRRRTGSKELAARVEYDLESVNNIYFLEIVKSRIKEANKIAMEYGLKGMDAIVVQVAKENNAALITLDGQMARLAARTVKIVPIERL